MLALLLAFAASGSPPPLDCPPGTSLAGGVPFESFEAWCEGRPDDFGHLRRHGPARRFYDDGSVWVEERFFEGKRDGPFLERHRNGRKAREGTYRLDGKVGTWTVWYEDGTLEERSEWVANSQHGPFTAWHRNGTKRTEGRFCHGVQCGTWITWDDGGHELGRVQLAEQQLQP